MEILIIRHAYPDYENDSLTEHGREEAACLAERLKQVRIDHICASPMGRAQLTMDYTAKAKGMSATTLKWLREVGPAKGGNPWGHPPENVLGMEALPAEGSWSSEVPWGEIFQPVFQEVTEGFDTLLAEHGYRRDGRVYKADQPNDDVLALFTHNGLIRTLLSYITNSALPVFLQHFHVSPCGLTNIRMTERDGCMVPELRTFNDVTHLDGFRKPRNGSKALPFAAYG
jgi:broad specificity phosphatase PhoE